MRILVVGAGGTGGYFGGRLLAAGRDVTFLVRPRRAAQLAADGLVIRSRLGDAVLVSPPTVLADGIEAPFDLVLLSCKAYDLAAAIDAFAAAVGAQTAILPVLNGMRHLDALDARFGRERVLGGQCVIAATLDEAGRVVHLNEAHSLTFGERDGGMSERIRRIADAFAGANFDSRPSATAAQDMWEKWVALATLAAGTCLMRAAIGDIVQAGGADLALTLLHECSAIASAHGFEPSVAANERVRTFLTDGASKITASMLKDIERGGPIEADHIIGDLIARAPTDALPTLLPIVLVHLKAYEARRARELATAPR